MRWLAFVLLGIYSVAMLMVEATGTPSAVLPYLASSRGPIPFVGIHGTLVAFFLWGAALIFALCLPRGSRPPGTSGPLFYLSQVAALVYFGACARFAVHQEIGAVLGVDGAVPLAVAMLLELLALGFLGRRSLRRRPIPALLAATGALFAAMAALDSFGTRDDYLHLSMSAVAELWASVLTLLVALELLRSSPNSSHSVPPPTRSIATPAPEAPPQRTEQAEVATGLFGLERPAASLLKALIVAILVLAALSILTDELFRSGQLSKHWRRYFNVDAEANPPTWFSSAILLLSGASCLAIWILRRPTNAERFYWPLLASAFAFLSLDETAQIHEILQRDYYDELGFANHWYVYLLPVVLPVAVYFAVMTWRVLRQHAVLRRMLIAGAITFLFGAVGVEFINNELRAHEYYEWGSTPYALISVLEEACEILGSSLCLVALVHHATGSLREVRAAVSHRS